MILRKSFSPFASRVFALACTLVGGLGQGVVAPRMPELLQGSQQMAMDSGLSATVMYLGIFVSTFGFGRLADRGRVHLLLALGLIGYASVLVLLAHAPTFATILALRGLEGIALSAVFVAADFLLGRLSEQKERGTWLSLYGVALSMGLLLGPVIALGLRHPGPFYLVAGCAGIFALLSLIGIRVPRVADAKARLPQFERAPLCAGAAYGFLEASLVAVLPVIAVQELGIKPEWGLIAIILSAALSSVPWGMLADRFGGGPIVKALLMILVAAPAGLLVGYQLGGLSGFSIGFSACVTFGILAGGLYPVGFAWLLEKSPESEYGAAAGAFTRAYGLGSLVGPFFSGVLVEHWHFSGLLGLLTILGGTALLSIRFFSPSMSLANTRLGVL